MRRPHPYTRLATVAIAVRGLHQGIGMVTPHDRFRLVVPDPLEPAELARVGSPTHVLWGGNGIYGDKGVVHRSSLGTRPQAGDL